MNAQRLPRLLVLLGLVVSASCEPIDTAREADRDRITQTSIINALMVGRYDGVTTIRELLDRGDFGLGTLDHLDGELIVLDGRVYQAKGDGEVVEVGPDATTPFAVITPFEDDGAFDCPEADGLAALEGRLDETIGRANTFVALRVQGTFASITFRSVPRQEPPYRPLAEVAEGQSVWTRSDLAGTLLGVRSPKWVGGLTVPGYHWHFLSDDRTVGGHVLDCRPVGGRVRYDLCREWDVMLPESTGFDEAVLTQDLSRELHRVESSRGPGDAPDDDRRGSDRPDPTAAP